MTEIDFCTVFFDISVYQFAEFVGENFLNFFIFIVFFPLLFFADDLEISLIFVPVFFQKFFFYEKFELVFHVR